MRLSLGTVPATLERMTGTLLFAVKKVGQPQVLDVTELWFNITHLNLSLSFA